METFDRDLEYILKKAEIKKGVGLRKDNVGRDGQTFDNVTRKYLQELNPRQYEQLIDVYQIDMDLFGYKAPSIF